jgi:cyclohexanone monooxygenase
MTKLGFAEHALHEEAECLAGRSTARPTSWTPAKRTPFGIAGHPPPTRSALEDAPEERERVYEQKWGTGGNISFLYAYDDLLANKDSNETASEFVRNKIRRVVHDPKVAELLLPNDHPIGTKRLCLDNGYFETFNRESVTLVDVRSDPSVEFAPSGLRTETREFGLDDIAFATGFDAMTERCSTLTFLSKVARASATNGLTTPAHISG